MKMMLARTLTVKRMHQGCAGSNSLLRQQSRHRGKARRVMIMTTLKVKVKRNERVHATLCHKIQVSLAG